MHAPASEIELIGAASRSKAAWTKAPYNNLAAVQLKNAFTARRVGVIFYFTKVGSL
jgi:hypothetical protein